MSIDDILQTAPEVRDILKEAKSRAAAVEASDRDYSELKGLVSCYVGYDSKHEELRNPQCFKCVIDEVCCLLNY